MTIVQMLPSVPHRFTRIDAALVAWLRDNADDPVAALDHAAAFYEIPRTLGSFQTTPGGISKVTGVAAHDGRLINVRIADGTLGCRIEHEGGEAVWEAGTLDVEARRLGAPDTAITAAAGRRLGDLVDADWLPMDAVIVEAERIGGVVAIRTKGWAMTVEEARTWLEREKT